MYGSWNKAERIKEKLTLCSRKLTLCSSKQLPVIVGEFGYNYDNGKNNLTCKVDHQTILDVCNELEYGYMPWSCTGNNKDNNWLDMADKSDWHTFTWWGEEVINGKGGIKETAEKASVFK